MDAEPDPAVIGQRIRQVREALGITQIWLAEQVRITKQAMYAIESGRSDPKATRVARIAFTLQVSADYLLGLTDKQVLRTGREISDVA